MLSIPLTPGSDLSPGYPTARFLVVADGGPPFPDLAVRVFGERTFAALFQCQVEEEFISCSSSAHATPTASSACNRLEIARTRSV